MWRYQHYPMGGSDGEPEPLKKRQLNNICPYCNTDVDVEREVFKKDKLFAGHSCQGSWLISRKQTCEDKSIVQRIKELIEEYADCRDEMDSLKVAVEIYELSVKGKGG